MVSASVSNRRPKRGTISSRKPKIGFLPAEKNRKAYFTGGSHINSAGGQKLASALALKIHQSRKFCTSTWMGSHKNAVLGYIMKHIPKHEQTSKKH